MLVGTEVYCYHYLDMAGTGIMGLFSRTVYNLNWTKPRLPLPEVFHGGGARKAKATQWIQGAHPLESLLIEQWKRR